MLFEENIIVRKTHLSSYGRQLISSLRRHYFSYSFHREPYSITFYVYIPRGTDYPILDLAALPNRKLIIPYYICVEEGCLSTKSDLDPSAPDPILCAELFTSRP